MNKTLIRKVLYVFLLGTACTVGFAGFGKLIDADEHNASHRFEEIMLLDDRDLAGMDFAELIELREDIHKAEFTKEIPSPVIDRELERVDAALENIHNR